MRINALFYLIPCLFVLSCLEEVSHVPREKAETTLFIVRNEGNSDDEVEVFFDSLLVGKTFKDKISEIIIPAGQHTLFFKYDRKYYGESFFVSPNSVVATRQYVLDAYMFKRVAFDSLTQDSLQLFLRRLPVEKFAYYEAKQKISTDTYNEWRSDFEDCKLEIREFRTAK